MVHKKIIKINIIQASDNKKGGGGGPCKCPLAPCWSSIDTTKLLSYNTHFVFHFFFRLPPTVSQIINKDVVYTLHNYYDDILAQTKKYQ